MFVRLAFSSNFQLLLKYAVYLAKEFTAACYSLEIGSLRNEMPAYLILAEIFIDELTKMQSE